MGWDTAIRVALAGSEELARRGFSLALQEERDIQVVAEARTTAQALRAVDECQPDVLLIDIQSPRGDCVNLVKVVLTQPHGTAPRIIVLSSHDFEDDLFLALQAGASGYLLKGSHAAGVGQCGPCGGGRRRGDLSDHAAPPAR